VTFNHILLLPQAHGDSEVCRHAAYALECPQERVWETAAWVNVNKPNKKLTGLSPGEGM
jgi:hypothetical protein